MSDFKQLSEAAKNRGTQAFKEHRFEEAIKEYSEALKYDETNGILYSNRSACYASLEQYEKALEDAELTVKYKPDWARGYSRKAFALLKLERYAEADRACEEGLKIEPENQMLKDIMAESDEKRRESNMKHVFDNWKPRLMAHPKTAGYMADPAFVAKMEELAKSNFDIQAFQRSPDERVMECLFVLMGIDLDNFKEQMNAQKQQQQQTQAPPQPQQQPKKEEPPKKEEVPKKEETPVNQTTGKEEEFQFEDEEKKEETKRKNQAQQEKLKGNEFYKQKKFTEALECYSKAMELDPEDLTFKLNKSAVYLEMEKYEDCISLCLELIDEYAAQRNYAQKPKLFMRIGNAYFKQEKYTEALEYYKKSCTEKRTGEILEKIKLAEKKKEAKEQAEYFSIEKGEQARQEGTKLFKEQRFPEAIKMYTEAIKRNPDDYLAYSNKAACYQKLGEHPYAIKEAEMCIKIKPDFVKGYNRKAFSHFCMKEYNKALQEYQRALKVEPNNQEARQGIESTERAIMGGNNMGETDEERVRHAMADPEIVGILSDPMMRNVLEEMTRNPASAAQYLQDPQIRTRIEKLIAAGVVKTA